VLTGAHTEQVLSEPQTVPLAQFPQLMAPPLQPLAMDPQELGEQVLGIQDEEGAGEGEKDVVVLRDLVVEPVAEGALDEVTDLVVEPEIEAAVDADTAEVAELVEEILRVLVED